MPCKSSTGGGHGNRDKSMENISRLLEKFSVRGRISAEKQMEQSEEVESSK